MRELLSDYGYLAIFLGSLLEGEVILVLAGYAAHQGYLSLPLVMLIACCGGTLGDQIFFFTGRRWGTFFLHKLPGSLQTRAERVNGLLLRYDAWLIVAVRFMYGLRIAGPIVIGMSTVSAHRFLRFNVLGAAIWAILIPGVGFVFGESMQRLLGPGARLEEYGALLVMTIIAVVLVVHRLRGNRKDKP